MFTRPIVADLEVVLSSPQVVHSLACVQLSRWMPYIWPLMADIGLIWATSGGGREVVHISTAPTINYYVKISLSNNKGVDNMDNKNKVPLGEFTSVLDLLAMIQEMRRKQVDYFAKRNGVTLSMCKLEEAKVKRGASRAIELGFPREIPVMVLEMLEAQQKYYASTSREDFRSALALEHQLDAVVAKALAEARKAAADLEAWNRMVGKPKS